MNYSKTEGNVASFDLFELSVAPSKFLNALVHEMRRSGHQVSSNHVMSLHGDIVAFAPG